MASAIQEYIIRSAQARGIDPNIALRVAKAEGGLNDPFRRGEGPAPKSQRFGGTEHSFGPFQLYVSGNNAGLGDRALAAGIDPRKNWQGGIDFALDEVKRDGWRQWYGAKNAGIDRWAGVGNRGTTLNSNPLAGNRAPPITETTVVGDAPIAEVAPAVDPVVAVNPDNPLAALPEGFLSGIAKDTAKGEKGALSSLASAFSGGGDAQDAQAQAHAAPIQSILPSLESADMTRMQMASQMMQSLMADKRKRFGTTLNSAPQLGVL